MVDKTHNGGNMGIVFALKKTFGDHWPKLFLKYTAGKDKFKNDFKVYCKLRSSNTLEEFINAKILDFFINRGTKFFGMKEREIRAIADFICGGCRLGAFVIIGDVLDSDYDRLIALGESI